MTTPAASPSGSRDRRVLWGLGIQALVLVVALTLLALSSGSDRPEQASDTPSMVEVAPGGRIALDDLPAEHRVLYEAAAADPDAFHAVACYCGCDSFLGHRDLFDCFVRPDGGWERHATGCGVCLAEARDVVDGRADGTPVPDIARRIDERFGAITAAQT